MTDKHYIGIDIGGTKILTALVTEKGKILARKKVPTPKDLDQAQFASLLDELIQTVIKKGKINESDLAGIGIAVPGIVDPETGIVLNSPNTGLTGVDLVSRFEDRYSVKVAVGNDVNVGMLGEKWLGAARDKKTVLGLFPGTGIGGAAIINEALVTGASGAAAEVGHMIVDEDGPVCNCGNTGCLEAFTGRWAIERDIREGLKRDKTSIIMELSGGDLSQIKSKMLATALKEQDPLVTDIMKKVSAKLGIACKSLRHIFDPQMIVFGGGVIEACGWFMLPIIDSTMNEDPLFEKVAPCEVVEAELGDDAVVLGAVAMILCPESSDDSPNAVEYPVVQVLKNGKVKTNNETHQKSLFIRADGKIKRWPQSIADLKTDDMAKLCKKNPEILFVGTDQNEKLSKEVAAYLDKINIKTNLLPVQDVVELYNKVDKRKALLLQLS